MNRRIRGDLKNFFSISAGWLFADLLLALAMVFLASNTFVYTRPAVKPTPTHPSTPTPVTRRILESNYCRILLDDRDPNKLSNDTQFAIATLEPQITSIGFLRDRQAGLAIAYGGLDNILDQDQQTRGFNMAKTTYAVLQDLGSKEQSPVITFKTTSYYEPLFTGFFSSRTVEIDIYLVVSPLNPGGNTCDVNHNHP